MTRNLRFELSPDGAIDLDDAVITREIERESHLRILRTTALSHGVKVAKITGGHVLVINHAGECLATRSAARLLAWLGY